MSPSRPFYARFLRNASKRSALTLAAIMCVGALLFGISDLSARPNAPKKSTTIAAHSDRSGRKISVAVSPGANVTPDGNNVILNGYSSSQANFTVQNPGTSSGTYSIAIVCTGAVSNCAPSTTSVTINAGAQTTVYVNYNSGGWASSGLVRLRATLNSNPAVKDSGHFNVTTTATPVISVTPDGGTVVVDPQTNPETYFSMANSGSGAQIQISPTCTGAVFVGTTCSPWPSPMWLGASPFYMSVTWSSSAVLGATGRIKVVVKAVNDTTIRDTAWVDVATKSTAPSATPDGGIASVEPNTATSTSFTVTNVGNTAASFYVQRTCSGTAIPNNCYSYNSIWLAAGASQNVSAAYTSGARGTTGRVRLWVMSEPFEGVQQTDTAWVNVSVIAHPAVSAGPDAQTITRLPNQDQTQSITLSNTGDATDTYYLQTQCTGEAFSVGCSLNTDSIVVPPQTMYGVTLGYRTGENLTAGRLFVLATSRIDPNVRDSAWVDVNVVNTIISTISVLPDGASQSGFTASSASRMAPFTLVGSGTFWMTATCTGAAIVGSCIPQATPAAVAAGEPYPLNVMFTSGPNGATGRITLTAKNNNDPTIIDVGSMDIKIGPAGAAAVSVTPDGDTDSPIPPRSSRTAWFTVSNPGNSTLTMNLAASCTGLAVSGGCTLGQSSVSLAPNAYATVPVTFISGSEASAGRIRVLATPISGTLPTDSGWVNLATASYATILVEPKGVNLTALAGSYREAVFRLKNIGGLTQTYNVKAVCSGQVFATACTPLNPSQVTIGAGTTDQWVVSFETGAVGRTGSVKIIAEVNGQPVLRDSGFVSVSSTSTSAVSVAVTPDNTSQFIYPSASSSTTFDVVNTGTTQGTFNFAGACSGGAISGSCTVSPSSATIYPGQSNLVTVSYTAGAVATTGRVSLTATLTTNTALKDSGLVNVSTGSIGNTTVDVSPDAEPWSLAPNTSWARAFLIRNTGPAAATFNLTGTCTGSAIQAGCTLSNSSVALPAGAQKYVTLTVTSGQTTGLIGKMKVNAVHSTNGAVSDSGWFDVVISNPKPVVTPDGTTYPIQPGLNGGVTFDVRNPTSTSQEYALSIRCQEAAFANGCAISKTNVVVNPGTSTWVSATFTASSSLGTGRVVLTATPLSGPVNSDTGWFNINVAVPVPPSVTVSPKAAAIAELFPNDSGAVVFDVTNPGTNGVAVVALTRNCSWNGSTISCVSSPDTLQLGAGATQTVRVAFLAGASSQSGVIRLKGTLVGTNPAVSDSGWYTVTAGTSSPSGVNVSVASVNPGLTIARNQCLTIAAGSDAAVECGDLRLVHELPATTTMGKTRAPTLLYNSRHAKPGAVIAADVSFNSGIAPDSLLATVVIPGKQNTNKSFTWQGTWPAQQVRRIAVPIDATQLAMPTGVYTYTLEVKAWTSGTPPVGTATGTMVIVNRSLSAFGEGWWLDGLEQLVAVSDSQKLWIGGDGSTRLYTKKAGTDTFFVKQMVDRPDALLGVVVGGTQYYRRLLRNRAYVEFNNAGQHIATVNSQQHRTHFWQTTVLDSIGLPNPTASANAFPYRFTYDTDGQGQKRVLTSVTAPSNPSATRTVTLEHEATWRVNKIIDPKKSGDPDVFVRFRYDNGRLVRRLNRLGDSTMYAYGLAGHITEAKIKLAGSDSILTTFCTAESRSLDTCASGPQALSTVVTSLFGPRPNVTTQFYVNRFGAPDTITNALGLKTRIRRTDSRFPMLATAVVQPNGFETQATYTDRGLLDRTTAIAPLDTNATPSPSAPNAVTRYAWHPTLDLVDSVIGPSGEETRFYYDAFGNREWQEDGRGVVSRVRFGYDVHNRVEWVLAPGNALGQEERLRYDHVGGNVERITAPSGHYTAMVADAVGRDTLTTSPLTTDPSSSIRLKERNRYDMMDRVVDHWLDAPALNQSFVHMNGESKNVQQMTRHDSTAYDAEGTPLSVTRRSENGQGGVLNFGTSATTTFTYDKVSRKLTEETNGGRRKAWTYDAAGNVVKDSSGLGIIVMTYDVLDRLQTRSVPSRKEARGQINNGVGAFPNDVVYYPYFRRPIGSTGNFLDTLVIFATVDTFAYDTTGNINLADNNDARVRRTYFRNGQLRNETAHIAQYTFDASPSAPVFSGNGYIQKYTYDLSGRRISRQDFNSACSGCLQTYQYHGQSGLLELTEDEGSTTGGRIPFRFEYDGAGRLQTRHTNGYGSQARVRVTHAYDADGLLEARTVISRATTEKTVFLDTHEYDGRGKKRVTRSGSDESTIPTDLVEVLYNGFGAVIGFGRSRGLTSVYVDSADALGNVLQRVTDPSLLVPHRIDYQVGGDQLGGANRPAYMINESIPDSTRFDTEYFYDSNGNQVQENRIVQKATSTPQGQLAQFATATSGHSWQWMMYGADNKLRYAQKTWYEGNAEKRTVFTEYRYDALGRRVLARTRRDTSCTGSDWKCLSTMDRFVWDGDQLLAEFRGPGANTQSETTLNEDGGNGSFYGLVRYTHAGGIDEPLAVWGGSGAGNAYGIVPHLSWRGHYEAGSDIQTGVLLESGSPTWIWPNRYKDINLAPEIGGSIPDPTRWLGSLLESQVDLNGLAYRRNRYYSPTTGRFTSEDPIGLAGGLNLYGFAEGDPVNHSDPLGLCTPFPECLTGFAGLRHALKLDQIPMTSNHGSRATLGVSGSLGLLGGSCTLGSGCGFNANLTPQFGASVDVGLKVRSLRDGEPGIGGSLGIEHLGWSLSNEGTTVSIGIGWGLPVNVTFVPNVLDRRVREEELPPIQPDQTRVERKVRKP
jgi:RHS repeat-associated protein